MSSREAYDDRLRLEVEVRVRYSECDPMNVAHHSVYPVWMEIARTELLRQRGVAYRELEARGVYFVVARLGVRYRKPARYDDVLRVIVQGLPSAGVKVDHEYEIRRGDELIAAAQTTLVCVDREGKLQPIPLGALGE
jgi:acyl-CoA thioester hydrolase